MDQPAVLNGFTDLLVSIWGDPQGKPARAAIPVHHPGWIPIEARAGPVGAIESVDIKGFDEAIGVVLRGVFLGIKHAASVMKGQGSGSIVNTASVAGLRTGYCNHIYSAAKAGSSS